MSCLNCGYTIYRLLTMRDALMEQRNGYHEAQSFNNMLKLAGFCRRKGSHFHVGWRPEWPESN